MLKGIEMEDKIKPSPLKQPFKKALAETDSGGSGSSAVVPEPLKDKELLVDTQLDGGSFGGLHDMFLVEDVAAAVEWLRKYLLETLMLDDYAVGSPRGEDYYLKIVNAKIDEAFADVVEVTYWKDE